MTILVVEDEPKTGVFLQQGLSEAGFAVERRPGFGGKRQMLAGSKNII